MNWILGYFLIGIGFLIWSFVFPDDEDTYADYLKYGIPIILIWPVIAVGETFLWIKRNFHLDFSWLNKNVKENRREKKEGKK